MLRPRRAPVPTDGLPRPPQRLLRDPLLLRFLLDLIRRPGSLRERAAEEGFGCVEARGLLVLFGWRAEGEAFVGDGEPEGLGQRAEVGFPAGDAATGEVACPTGATGEVACPTGAVGLVHAHDAVPITPSRSRCHSHPPTAAATASAKARFSAGVPCIPLHSSTPGPTRQ